MDSSSYYGGAGDYNREAVRFFDVAHEGAQLRAVANAADVLGQLRGQRPRSVVVVASDSLALAAARFVVERRAPIRYPLTITRTLPAFVGALDIVVVVGDAADNDDISLALLPQASAAPP